MFARNGDGTRSVRRVAWTCDKMSEPQMNADEMMNHDPGPHPTVWIQCEI